MEEMMKFPLPDSKCVVCGEALNRHKKHHWAKARRGGISYICPKCAGKKVNQDARY